MAKEASLSATSASSAVDKAGAKPDPQLLGVEIPLNITMNAVKLVSDAWKTCFVDLSAAFKDKLATKEAEAATSTKSSPQPPVASA